MGIAAARALVRNARAASGHGPVLGHIIPIRCTVSVHPLLAPYPCTVRRTSCCTVSARDGSGSAWSPARPFPAGRSPGDRSRSADRVASAQAAPDPKAAVPCWPPCRGCAQSPQGIGRSCSSNSEAGTPSTSRSAFSMNSNGRSPRRDTRSISTALPAEAPPCSVAGSRKRTWRTMRSAKLSLPCAPAPMPR